MITREQAELLLDYFDARLRLHSKKWDSSHEHRKEANALRETGDELRSRLLETFGPPTEPIVREEPTRNWRKVFNNRELNLRVPGRVLHQVREASTGDLIITYHGTKMDGAELV